MGVTCRAEVARPFLSTNGQTLPLSEVLALRAEVTAVSGVEKCPAGRGFERRKRSITQHLIFSFFINLNFLIV